MATVATANCAGFYIGVWEEKVKYKHTSLFEVFIFGQVSPERAF